MQFSSQTEYSIRILVYLTCKQKQGKGTATIATLSQELGINRNYIPKILKPLKDHKMLQSESGSQGGFSLLIDPDKTSLLDIFEVTEGTIKLNQCISDFKSCNLNRESICPVRKIYMDFQELFEEYFGNKTLADLANQEIIMQNQRNYKIID